MCWAPTEARPASPLGRGVLDRGPVGGGQAAAGAPESSAAVGVRSRSPGPFHGSRGGLGTERVSARGPRLMSEGTGGSVGFLGLSHEGPEGGTPRSSRLWSLGCGGLVLDHSVGRAGSFWKLWVLPVASLLLLVLPAALGSPWLMAAFSPVPACVLLTPPKSPSRFVQGHSSLDVGLPRFRMIPCQET